MKSTLSLMDQLRAIERGHLPSRALMDLGGGYAPPVPIASKGVVAKKANHGKAGGLRKEKSAVSGVRESEVDDARSLVTHLSQSSLLSSDSLREMLSKPALGVVKVSEKKASFAGAEHDGDAAALAKQISLMRRQLHEKQEQRLESSSKLLSGVATHEQRIEKGIWDSVHLLPTKLLIKHGKQEYVQGRALEEWRDLWRRRNLRLAQDGFLRWIRFLDDERNVFRKQAGALITRIARGYLGRLRMRAHRRRLDAANIKAQRMAAIQNMGRVQRVVIIQRMARRVAAKERVRPLLARHRGSLTIQRFFKTRLIMMQAKKNIRRRRCEDKAARLIQRIARGFAGRRRFKQARRAARHLAVQKRLERPESTYEYYFEQAGAAVRIQRWWRSLPLVYKAVWRGKYWAFYVKRKRDWLTSGVSSPGGGKSGATARATARRRKNKGGKQAHNPAYTAMLSKQLTKKQKRTNIANAVNPIVRGFLGRRRCERLVAQRKALVALRQLSITLIQAHARRLLVCASLPSIGPRSRALVRKLRRWSRLKPVKPLLRPPLLPLLLAAGGGGAGGGRRRLPKEWADINTPTVALKDDADWLALDPKPNMGRRGAVSCQNLAIPNAKAVPKLYTALYTIVCAYRRMKARRILASLRGQRHLFASARMQRWARVCLVRRRCLRLRGLILPLFERCRQRREAAKRIQTRWKVYHATRWLTKIRYARKVGVPRLQRWMRRIVARLRRKLLLHSKRSAREVRAAGAEQYRATEIFTLIDFIWQGAKKTRTTDVPHDMQKFFVQNSTGSMMDLSQAGRVAKDVGLLGKGGLDIQTFEQQFGKVKAPTEKRLDYPRWLELLANVGAIKLLGVSSAVLKGASNEEYDQGIAKARGEDVGKTTEELEAEGKIKAFRYGRYAGRTALIMKITYKHLVPSTDWKKVGTQLAKKSSAHLSEKHLRQCVLTCQKFARNRMAIKSIHRGWRTLRALKLRRRDDRMAMRIQTLIRHFLGRRRITRMAQSVYSKFIDDETEAVYWYNPRTGNAFWTKPKMLGLLDCGMPIRMPHVDEQYVVVCFSCQEKTANVYCDECDFAYCSSCFTTAHRGGKRRGHHDMHLDMCVQCDFQVATKLCVQCKDLFCESCYKNVHSKGRLRLHISTWVTDTCEECGQRAARWTQHEMKNNTGQFQWCLPCFRDAYQTEPRISRENSFFLRPYNFQGKSVRDFRGKRASDEAKRKVAEDYAARAAELKVLKKQRCATNIQRVWRGVRSRRSPAILSFIADRRVFFALREKQMPLRANPVFKFLEFWGVAPRLQSDTMLERVHHQYPSHMRHIVQECLRGQWKEACRLQREQEEHLKRIGSPSLVQTYLARMAVLNSTRLLMAAESVLRRRSTVLDLHKSRYRDARANSRTPAAILKELLHVAEKTSSEVELAQAMREKRLEELGQAEQRAVDFMGPRGLQKLISQRRKEGVALPFTVTMIQGSTLALVNWVGSVSAESRPQPLLALPPVLTDAGAAGGENDKNDKNDKASESLLALAMGSGYNPSTGTTMPAAGSAGSAGLGGEQHSEGVEGAQPQPPTPPCPYKAAGFREPPPPDAPSLSKWTSVVSEFDTLLIRGIHFTALPPHFYEHGPRNAEDEAEEARLKAEKEEEEMDDADSDAASEDADEVEEYKDATDDLYPKVALTPAHIVLDRPWLFASIQDLPCFRAVPSTFYVKPFREAGHALVSSFVPQKAVAISAITLNKLAELNTYLASMFDAESDTGLWLRQNAKALEHQRDTALRVSRSMVQLHTYDFSLRRRMAKNTTRSLKAGYELLQRLKRVFERAAGDPAAAALSYEVWEQSKKKVEVEVYYERPPAHKGGDPQQEQLGVLHMDLEAPVPVMREYVQRTCRDRLNELAGDSFLFLKQLDDGSDFILPRDAEIRTFSKDFVPFKMDNKTMLAAFKLVLVPEPLEEGGAGTFIQEFKDHHKKHHKKAKDAEPGPSP